MRRRPERPGGSASGQPAPWGVCQVGCSGEKPVQLTAGYLHTCALTSDARAYCWGRGASGQLGLGQFGYSSVPVDVRNVVLSLFDGGFEF